MRVAVDEVDEQIVSLIGRRERLIRIAGTLKADSAEVRAPGRVERVIEHVRATAEQKDIDVELVEKTYRAMIDAFITLELEVYKASSSVAQGVPRGLPPPARSPGSPGRHSR